MHRQGHDTASIGSVMRPLHQAVKDVSRTMTESPIYQRTKAYPSNSGYVTPVPATPLSAALGPAALATVPNTPREAAAMNQGEYFPGGGSLAGVPDGLRSGSSVSGDKMLRYARDIRGA